MQQLDEVLQCKPEKEEGGALYGVQRRRPFLRAPGH